MTVGVSQGQGFSVAARSRAPDLASLGRAQPHLTVSVIHSDRRYNARTAQRHVARPLPPGIFVITILSVEISYDPAKRDKVLAERSLDFAQAGAVFAGLVAEIEDTRRGYGEQHFVTAGTLDGRLVVIVWTPRDGSRRIISMRHAHDREEALWRQLLG